MTIYIDITQFERGRANTGVQRVLTNFISKAFISYPDIDYKVVIYNSRIKKMELLPLEEVKLFLQDITNFQFQNKQIIEIETIQPTSTTLFFDIDAAWNAPYKRDLLYPILKDNGFMICNFIHDLIPVLLPEVVHDLTVVNYKKFIHTVYDYSDMVFFNSHSSQNDFFKIKNILKKERYIASRVVGLGSNFFDKTDKNENITIDPILKTKYILFVGTLEPRKNQEDLFDAFVDLSEKYSDLNLVLVGKKGWKIDSFIEKLKSHPLKDIRIFWFDNIDDNSLSFLYKNAFLVTYLSKYEGYGLPITESLGYGKITITSKNSSMYEAGKNYADYIEYGTKNELIDIISLYSDNKQLYNAKQNYIHENFIPITWDIFTDSILQGITNLPKSIELAQNHLKNLQFIFISINIDNISKTIENIDKYVDFVKEYIIITSPKLVSTFKNIKTTNKLRIIDETDILGIHANDFHLKDHVSKNWILRASILNIASLDDEFIMLDDDNIPIKNITKEKFITKDGRYNAYFFYNLLDWHHKDTDYDKAQQNMKDVLFKKNYELLSYSSHAPQIINKAIFKEAVSEFFDLGLTTPIDEWSIYFNYAISNYPYLFNKKLFETLNWPESPVYWDSKFNQNNISFENYYKNVYDTNMLHHKDSYEQKLKKKKKQIAPFVKTKKFFKQNKKIYSQNNMVHGVLEFKDENFEFYLSNIPYYFIVEKDGTLRLRLNYKLLNLKNRDLDIAIVLSYDERVRVVKRLTEINKTLYQESIVEIPITTQRVKVGIYDISINLKVGDTYIFKKSSPYLVKLIVSKNKDYLAALKNPQTIESKIMPNDSIKQKIKNIPVLGWFARWSYNLLRLNNLKHRVHHQQQTINKQQRQIEQQQRQINQLNSYIDKQVVSQVAKQISIQSDSLQQQMDQFIFDANINKKIDDK